MAVHPHVKVLTEKGLRYIYNHSNNLAHIEMAKEELLRRNKKLDILLPKAKERDEYERG
jgi:hypothetical protein